jgi:hypothetical protein
MDWLILMAKTDFGSIWFFRWHRTRRGDRH